VPPLPDLPLPEERRQRRLVELERAAAAHEHAADKREHIAGFLDEHGRHALAGVHRRAAERLRAKAEDVHRRAADYD